MGFREGCLGDDIGVQQGFNTQNLVFEHQFAFLHPLHLNLIKIRRDD